MNAILFDELDLSQNWKKQTFDVSQKAFSYKQMKRADFVRSSCVARFLR